MKKYKHILFDLDHTLWDFERNSQETLTELFETFELSALGTFSCDDFCHTFRTVNQELWKLYTKGEYNQESLRSERFKIILSKLGVAAHHVPASLATEYLRICPTKPYIFPHTLETLAYLQQHYTLHIVTNGFADVQAIKMQSSGLTDFFAEVITSDTAGYKKPHKGIFDYMLQKIDARCEECIMIGDNLEADIQGACNAGIDCIFFNPLQIAHRQKTSYEINSLQELQNIL